MHALVAEIGITGLIDIGFMTLLIYSLLVWLARTKRAAAILVGIVIVFLVYLFARQFNLHLTAAVLQGFFAVILVALVVMFQEELRSFFERIAQWGFSRPLPLGRKVPESPVPLELVGSTLTDLARRHIGALVVVRGRDLLVRHLQGGEVLGGQASRAILQSIFDPHSAGHDGAVVLNGPVIEQFGCRLPFSNNQALLQDRGTRHAAALGLSELTDALCLVVSEERGTISAARHGEWRLVPDADQLRQVLGEFYAEVAPIERTRLVQDFIRKNSREKLIALGLAVGLWFVLVHESHIIYRSYNVPVQVPPLPAELTVGDIQPKIVRVTLSGLRRDFFLSGPTRLVVLVKPLTPVAGRQQVALADSDLAVPENLTLERIEPHQISIQLDTKIATPRP